MPSFPCILHCALAVDNFITFLSYEIERLSFLARPCRVSAFGALHHLQASNKHSVVCQLWRRVTRVLKNCKSHNLTSPFVARGARVLRGIENQITQHRPYLLCSFVNIWLSSWLGHAQKSAMAVTPRNPAGFLRGAFSLEKD